MTTPDEALDRELALWAAAARAWGLRRVRQLYAGFDTDDIDGSFRRIVPWLTFTYAQLGVYALSTVDEYWRIKFALSGFRADFDWRVSQGRFPVTLPSGLPVRTYMERAPLVMKSQIRRGASPQVALRSSFGRTAKAVGTVAHQAVRDTVATRSYAIDVAGRSARSRVALPSARGVLVPPPLAPALDEVVELAPITPRPAPAVAGEVARSVSEPEPDPVVDLPEPTVVDWRQGPRVLYRRVPSVGACDFCLTLASRGAVYSAETVLTKWNGAPYHDNCKCSARADVKGVKGFVLSRPDFERLQESYRRDGKRAVAGSPRQFGVAVTRFDRRYENFYTLDGYRDDIYVFEPGPDGKPPLANWDRSVLSLVRPALTRR